MEHAGVRFSGGVQCRFWQKLWEYNPNKELPNKNNKVMQDKLIEFFKNNGYNLFSALEAAADCDLLLPEMGVNKVISRFTFELQQNKEFKKILVEMASDRVPLSKLIDKTNGRLAEALCFANLIGTTTLVRSLNHLTMTTGKSVSGKEVIVVIYPDCTPNSLYFVRYCENPEGEHLIDGKRYSFSGNGGIIYHSYCQEWSTHT